ncbi:MAG: hypothetical protein Q4E33_00565 [Erysipelotrichaceae bacterium]|nr:hypothetical protein [Erysipelotrichaceae bacterium]
MELINKNLKKVGIVNSISIAVAICLRLFQLKDTHLIANIDGVVCILTLLFGIFYSLSGYKKDAAKYFKIFTLLFLASSIVTVACGIDLIMANEGPIITNQGYSLVASSLAIVFCAAIIAFGKDLGKKKSSNLSYIIMVADVVKLLHSLFIKNETFIATDFLNLVLAIILLVFISAKYADKASRGAK